MKNFFILLALLGLIGLFLASCDFGTTYALDESDTEGGCIEVTTSDEDIIADLEAEGFTEGSCPGGSVYNCDVTQALEEGGDDVEMTVYFYSPEFDAESAAIWCAIMQAGGL